MKAGPRSLILITVDCLRADRLAHSGNQRAIAPFLDSLANECFVFKNAYASGIPTYYSLPALMASRHPLALGRDAVGIAPGESTIATELKECGFQSAAFVAGNPYVCAEHGYDSGFDVFQNFLSADESEFGEEKDGPQKSLRGRANRWISKACHSLPGLGSAYDEIYFQYCQNSIRSNRASFDNLRRFPSADVIVDCAIAWLQQNFASPLFRWLHLMDPHAPYYPKAEALQQGSELGPAEARRLNSLWAREDLSSRRLLKSRPSIECLYDSGVRWADRQIGRLAKKLVELNLWEQCALAVTADHGEEFLDHGGKFHPPVNLHEELIRVPLLMRVPGHPQGRNVTYPIGLIDLAPTLFDTLDIPVPASFRGRSCWQKLKNDQPWDWPVVTECVHGCTNPFRTETRLSSRLLSVRKGEYKLVINCAEGSDQLFRLSSDPGEVNPLPADTASDVRKQLLECAKKHVQESLKSRDMDLRFAAQLRELRAQWGRPIAQPN